MTEKQAVDDPNLFLFEEFYGCPGCAANWQKPYSVKIYGRVEVSCEGSFSGSGDFLEGETPEINGGNITPDHEESYYCADCMEFMEYAELYVSQAEVNEVRDPTYEDS